MKSLIKKTAESLKAALFLGFLSLSPAFIFSEQAFFQNENYSISVKYTKELVPGDAVFARMNLTPQKNHRKNQTGVKASLQLFRNGKLAESSPFYQINAKKSRQSIEMLSGVPVSIWTETEGNYELKIVFLQGDEKVSKEFSLPVIFSLRKFNNEDLPLDEKNTGIKTDASPERMAQIEKLNAILFTTNAADVYQLRAFTSPTDSTRYTSFCGDRRTYIFSNGKKSKNIHFGNDYGIPSGSDVKSCAEGKVVLAENRISTGWSIVIEHLPGLYSLYYHLSEMKVSEGDMVKQGQLIGKSGATGLATGPHLHWEMRLNGSAIVPEFFLKDFTFEEE